jgi:hypothetical protein
MGHWSSSKYFTDYKDEDGKEVNQPTPSLEREEKPAEDDGELAKDDGEPAADDEEEAPQAAEEEEKEEEAPAEEVDNITETIPPGFGPMPCNKKCKLNPLSPNMIMEDEDDSSSE